MIPPELFRRLADLKERADLHEGAAAVEHAEARGMEEVLEAWQASIESAAPPRIDAAAEEQKIWRIRAMVREEVFARPAGISPAEIRDHIGSVELSQVETALTYWAAKQEITWIDNIVCPRARFLVTNPGQGYSTYHVADQPLVK